MAITTKPRLGRARVEALLAAVHPDPVTRIEPLPEGEDSQVVRFQARDQWYVLRLRPSAAGFRKDAYAAAHCASAALPIPHVVRIGAVDDTLAYCLSAYVAGTTVQDLDGPALDATLPQVLALHEALARVPTPRTTGFGAFDADGVAPAPS